MSRPTVSILGLDGKASGSATLPSVMSAPIRHDVIKYVVAQVSKNKRQAHGLNRRAGHKHSAESWGTGRAVSRIPRVSGGGTHATGSGAFGNMCRGGHMFSMTKIFRRWHVAVPRKIRRLAVASAIAASASTALVAARGHHISNVKEVPLVVDDGIEKIAKTKDALALLKSVGVLGDVLRVRNSIKIRPGQGKSRNRRYVTRKGPLVVVKDTTTARAAFRGIPGTKAVAVSRLSPLDLAPGGHLGRLVVWSASALNELDAIYGSAETQCPKKAGFRLPRSSMVNADVTSILNKDEIQSVLRPKRIQRVKAVRSLNPLRNLKALKKLDPIGAARRASARGHVKSKESSYKLRRTRIANLRKSLTTKSAEKTAKTAKPAAKTAAQPTKAAAPAAAPKVAAKAK